MHFVYSPHNNFYIYHILHIEINKEFSEKGMTDYPISPNARNVYYRVKLLFSVYLYFIYNTCTSIAVVFFI